LNFDDDPCVKAWMGRVNGASRAFGVFKRFWTEALSKSKPFLGMSPSVVVEWQANARGRESYLVKGLAQQWINGHGKWRIKTKQSYMSHISSFFMHNHAPLPPDPSFHFTSEEPPVEGLLTYERFKIVLLSSKKMWRAIFLMMAQSLMGCGELAYVNTHHAELVLESLTKNVGIFKLGLPGRKRNRNVKNYYTMLSTKSDWADAMRIYLKARADLPRSILFRNNKGNPVSEADIRRYFHMRAVQTGIVKQASPTCTCGGETVRTRKGTKLTYKCRECGKVEWASNVDWNGKTVRYGVNPHEIRDLMRSRWRASGAKTVVAEYMMGHTEKIDPNEYDNMSYTPSDPIVEYRRALPWLNILSHDPERVDRHEIEAKLEERDRELDELKRKLAVLDDPALLEALRELKKRSQQ